MNAREPLLLPTNGDPVELTGADKIDAWSIFSNAFDHREMNGQWPVDLMIEDIPAAALHGAGAAGADPALRYVHLAASATGIGLLHLFARIIQPDSPAYPLDIVKAAKAACINPDAAYIRRDDAFDSEALRSLLRIDSENREHNSANMEPHPLSAFYIAAWVEPLGARSIQ